MVKVDWSWLDSVLEIGLQLGLELACRIQQNFCVLVGS